MKWKDLSKKIQNRMLECQVEQGNEKDESVFEYDCYAGALDGGFYWANTEEGLSFWEPILMADVDCEKYPMASKSKLQGYQGKTHTSAHHEPIEHPNHYGGDTLYEAIKVIEAWDLNFRLGNTVKYISRMGKKRDKLGDLKKAMWYLKREIDVLERRC